MDPLPPGSHRIHNVRQERLLLAPQPGPDPNEPLNWSNQRKYVHVLLLSLYSLICWAIMNVATTLWQNYNDELGISFDLSNYGYAASQAGLSVGCLIFVPFALRIGRRPIYVLTAFLMMGAAIWQAKMKTAGEMLAANVLSGIAGSVNEALFQITVADLFFVHQRGRMNGIYLLMVVISNFAATAAGYIAVSQGWRWVWTYCAMFMGIIGVALIFFLEESKYNPPVLAGQRIVEDEDQSQLGRETTITSTTKIIAQERQTSADATDTTDDGRRPSHERLVPLDTSIPMHPYRERLAIWTLDRDDKEKEHGLWSTHFYQPFAILFSFPAVVFGAVQYGFAIALIAILVVVQGSVFPMPPYNFSPVGIGNMAIPPVLGAILGTIYGGPLTDLFIVQVAKRRNGIYHPESRLYPFIFSGIVGVMGILVFGIPIAQGKPWIIVAVGNVFASFAIGSSADISLTYVQDSYQNILGPALTGIVFIRNIIATGLIFGIPKWMESMGVRDMSIVVAMIALVVTLTGIPMIVWGKRWRIQLAPRYHHFEKVVGYVHP